MKNIKQPGEHHFLLFSFLFLIPLLCFSACNKSGVQSSAVNETSANNRDGTLGATTQNSLILPSVDRDFFEVFCDNCHVEAYSAFSCTNGASFSLVSAQPLSEADVSVTSSYVGEYTTVLVDENYGNVTDQFTEDLFFLYQGYTAEKISQYYANALSDAEREEMDQLRLEFQSLPEEQIPVLYLYTLYFLPQMTGPYDVRDMTVTISGISKTYYFEQMTYAIEDAPYTVYPEEVEPLEVITFISDGKNIAPNTDGLSSISGIQLIANSNVSLAAIRFYNAPEVEILRTDLTITDRFGNTVTSQWDMGNDFDISKGDEISMTLYVSDPDTAGLLWQNRSRFIMMDYSCDGKDIYTTSCSIFFWQRLANPYEYLAALDGCDVLNYKIQFSKLLE